MSELRMVPFGVDYWHVVDDTEGIEGIIGSILRNTRPEDLLPWRAEFTERPVRRVLPDGAGGSRLSAKEAR